MERDVYAHVPSPSLPNQMIPVLLGVQPRWFGTLFSSQSVEIRFYLAPRLFVPFSLSCTFTTYSRQQQVVNKRYLLKRLRFDNVLYSIMQDRHTMHKVIRVTYGKGDQLFPAETTLVLQLPGARVALDDSCLPGGDHADDSPAPATRVTERFLTDFRRRHCRHAWMV